MKRRSDSKPLRVVMLCIGLLLVGVAAAGCGGSGTAATTTAVAQPSVTTTGSTPAETTAATATVTQGSAATAGQSTPATSGGGGKLTYGANTVEYAAPVTAAQAQQFLDYLAATFSWDKTSPSGMSFAVAKNDTDYELAMVIQKGKETDPTILASAKNLAQDSSQKVFGGAKVAVYLTDASWNVLAEVKQ